MYYATFVFEMQQVTKPFAGKVIDFSCSGTENIYNCREPAKDSACEVAAGSIPAVIFEF